MVRVARESVCSFILGAFEPLSCEIVSHKASSKSLEARIFDFIQSMGIQDGDQWAMVCEDREVVGSREEDVAHLHSPGDCKAFEFNDGIPALGVSEEPGAGLYHPGLFVAILCLL